MTTPSSEPRKTPFLYGHHVKGLEEATNVERVKGIGVCGLPVITDAEGRPAAMVSFLLIDPETGEEEAYAYILSPTMMGVLLGYMQEYGRAAGIDGFMRAEADRAATELRRLDYPILDTKGWTG